MNGLLVLIPMALVLGGLGLAAFLWALRSGQFDDLDGAAHRILFDDEPETPAASSPSDERDGASGPDRRPDPCKK